MSPTRMKMTGCIRGLPADANGTTLMEFALIFPTFMLLLLGLFDIGQVVYAQSLLGGAVQEAARNSTLETGNTAAADARIRNIVKVVAPDVVVTTSRKSYFDFGDIARPEQWNDEDNNGQCNDDESFTDENSNGQWDADIGAGGNGGASDVVVYSATATFSPLFPNPFRIGGMGDHTISTATVRKNQPFANQVGYSAEAGVCE
jgi:hypothetical protein